LDGNKVNPYYMPCLLPGTACLFRDWRRRACFCQFTYWSVR